MDYQRAYDQLIAKRQSEAPTGYAENHHIVPKCMGGLDESSNLVSLSAREHFLAHLLLWKIHKTPQTAYAVWMMQCFNSKQDRHEIRNSRQYQKIREFVVSLLKSTPKTAEHRANLSKANSGKKRQPHSEETKEKIRLAAVGRKNSPEHCTKVGDALRGRVYGPMSQEHRDKIRKANSGKLKSDEHRTKLSIAATLRERKPHSEETKAKMRKPKSDEWKANAKLTQQARRLREKEAKNYV
jgi:hypothetical protein